jgi:hypothetical protein
MTTGNTPLTGAQIAQAAFAIAAADASLLPSGVGIAVTIANQLYGVAMQALASGNDVSDADLDAALDADAAEKLLDQAAEARAAAREAAAAGAAPPS